MTKKEVEMNEEGVFRKWLEGCDAVVDEWREEGEEREKERKEREKRREMGEEEEEGKAVNEDTEAFEWPRSTSKSEVILFIESGRFRNDGSDRTRVQQSSTRASDFPSQLTLLPFPLPPSQPSSNATSRYIVNSGGRQKCPPSSSFSSTYVAHLSTSLPPSKTSSPPSSLARKLSSS